ncbi:MAG: hypothetical protein Q9200_006462 [Gallowayella weberi]
MMDEDEGNGRQGSIQCPWILPGQSCDFTVDTKNALEKHIHEQHIDPQLTMRCPIESCSQVVPKTNLPNHQAQQHQLDNYLCSTNDCAEIYRRPDDLLEHIRSSHEQLDCRFAGCEVSTKDSMQLKHHVVAEHLDPNYAWLEDPMFNGQYCINTDLNCPGMLEGTTNVANYQAYQQTGGQQSSVPYYGSNLCYPAAYSSICTDYNQHASTVHTNPILCHQNTFADSALTAWREPQSCDWVPLNLNNVPRVANMTNLASSDDAVTTPSSDNGTQTNGHVCKWIVNTNSNAWCNQAFDTSKALQEHLRRVHCTPGNGSRSIPKAPAICRWHGCGRKGEPLTDVHKLIRHALTHSDYRDFTCSYCGKQCTTKGQLVIHERVHTGEKPIKCEYCSKTASNESQMGKHSKASYTHVQC